MSISMLLIIVLLVLLIGSIPGLGFHSYGYAPSSIITILLIILIVLLLTGRL
jgi:hypothetical protein